LVAALGLRASDGPTRSYVFGPTRGQTTGLDVYHRPVIPALRDVEKVEVRGILGDGHYAFGHLLLAVPNPE
jgi:hypothetical protein